MSFAEDYGTLTVKEARKLNRQAIRQELKRKINWEKVLAFGLGIGFGASALYLLLVLTAHITA